MDWAMQTALPAEDALAILARAELYEEWVMAPLAAHNATTGLARVCLDRNKVGVDRRK